MVIAPARRVAGTGPQVVCLMLTLKRYAALRRGRERLPGACLRVVAVGARILGEDEVARVGRRAGSERPAGHAHEVEPARVRVSAGESKRQSVAIAPPDPAAHWGQGTPDPDSS